MYDFNFYDFAFLEDPCRRSYTFGFAHKLIPNGYLDYVCSIYLNKQTLVKWQLKIAHIILSNREYTYTRVEFGVGSRNQIMKQERQFLVVYV